MDYFGSSDENKKIFDTMPNLKCVSTVSAGYDHLGMVTYGWNKKKKFVHFYPVHYHIVWSICPNPIKIHVNSHRKTSAISETEI